MQLSFLQSYTDQGIIGLVYITENPLKPLSKMLIPSQAFGIVLIVLYKEPHFNVLEEAK